jgi:hypothetical protein
MKVRLPTNLSFMSLNARALKGACRSARGSTSMLGLLGCLPTFTGMSTGAGR